MDEITWKKNIKRPHSYPLDQGVTKHGQYTIHHQPSGKEVVRYYPSALGQASTNLGTHDDLAIALEVVEAHNREAGEIPVNIGEEVSYKGARRTHT